MPKGWWLSELKACKGLPMSVQVRDHGFILRRHLQITNQDAYLTPEAFGVSWSRDPWMAPVFSSRQEAEDKALEVLEDINVACDIIEVPYR